ncbi:serine hydrolase [Flavobacterium magnum]|nr:serine hydrolase [Flavobacterium magnum]
MTNPSTKKYSVWHILVMSVIVAGLTFLASGYIGGKNDKKDETAIAGYACNYNIKRLEGYKFIKPIMFVDGDCESESLQPIKSKLTGIIEQYKTNNGVINASVYLRSNREWIDINGNEAYEPGSLFKVPVMMAILKMSEESPGFLNKLVAYNKVFDINKHVMYSDKSIQLGHNYTIKELLEYMIRYSDNNATALLETYMKPEILQKMFADIGLEVPNMYAQHYYFNASQYSLFMRSIYNANYLSAKNSEYAAELLSECEFKDGIAKGLPAGVKLVHKFGEAGSVDQIQLHESAIIYVDGKSYLLTVMTKGKDTKALSALIGEISREVYNDRKGA